MSLNLLSENPSSLLSAEFVFVAGKAPDSGLTILVDHKNPAPFLGGITNGFSVAKINGWQVYDVDGEQLDFPQNTNNIPSTNKIIFVVGRKPHD